jgi:hypothetical protein
MLTASARTWLLLTCLFGLVGFQPPVLATDRYYADIVKSSPNGRFRLEAKSPDNQRPEGPQRAFARNFQYTLTDTQTSSVLWKYAQGESDASPVAAWVHDSGWTVVRSGWDELLAFNPATGQANGKLKILDEFPAAERAQFVHQTTAGPMWSQSSRWYFQEIEGKLYFVVRAHWGRRVVLDLASGKNVADTAAVKAKLNDGERDWVLATLKANTPLLIGDEPGEPCRDVITDTMAAIDIASRDQVQGAVKFLRSLESSEYVGSSGMIPIHIGKFQQGEIDPYAYSEYTIRSKAQQALRKLGHTPSELPGIAFRPVGRYDQESLIKPKPAEPRALALTTVRVGASAQEVLDSVGGPDRIHREGNKIAWEYHVDGPDAHTVHVFWSKPFPPVVASTTKVSPPTWKAREDIDR